MARILCGKRERRKGGEIECDSKQKQRNIVTIIERQAQVLMGKGV